VDGADVVDGVVLGESLFVSLEAGFASDVSVLPLAGTGAESLLAEPLRLSFAYQPLPLNTIAGGVSTRLASPLQSGHCCTGGASNPSRFS
jgi:hypothetical protein